MSIQHFAILGMLLFQQWSWRFLYNAGLKKKKISDHILNVYLCVVMSSIILSDAMSSMILSDSDTVVKMFVNFSNLIFRIISILFLKAQMFKEGT